jgi:hypothetical protein
MSTKKTKGTNTSTTTKTAKNGKAREQLAGFRTTAIEHEEAGRWSAASVAWDAIATCTAATGKERSEAAGRAAAARVRAEGVHTIDRSDSQETPPAADEVARVEHAIETATGEPPAAPVTEEVVRVYEATIAEGGTRDEAGLAAADAIAPEGEPAAEMVESATAAAEAAVEAAQAMASGGERPAPEQPAPAKRARKAPAEPKAPKERDPRLPAPGTPLRHVVRGEVKAEAVEQEDGTFLYAGTAYPSIHKAAFAAQQSLGMKNSGANGFRFFDLDGDRKPVERKPREPREPGHLAAVGKAWEKYAKTVGEAIAAAGTDAAKRAELLAALDPQVRALMALAASLGTPAESEPTEQPATSDEAVA